MMVKDPVCGMTAEKREAAGQSVFGGQTYYFCTPGCKEKFTKDAEKYLGKQDK